MTIAAKITLWEKPDLGIVEVLFDQQKLSIEWVILELAFEYDYKDKIKEIEIINYWNGDELQSRIIAESSGLRDEQARSDNGVLSEYYDNKKPYPKSFSR